MNALTIHDRHFGGVVTRRSTSAWVPDLVAAAGPRATDAYIEFFTATIRNRNTRLAYARACYQFFHWCQENGLTLDTVRPFHVAAYIEQMPGSKPTVKQKLAAIRMLYDFLVIRQLVPVNPTASVRGPKYVVKRGKTPVWSREDAKKLLESIPRDDLAGLRDRALISTMLFSFARISAVLSLKRRSCLAPFSTKKGPSKIFFWFPEMERAKNWECLFPRWCKGAG